MDVTPTAPLRPVAAMRAPEPRPAPAREPGPEPEAGREDPIAPEPEEGEAASAPGATRERKPAPEAADRALPQGSVMNDDGYILPPADLLEEAQPMAGNSQEQLVQERSIVLMKALRQFGIEANVVQVDRGPVVTMYELSPAPGVKVHRIMALENDIAMALKATSIRIVAPIPGKSTVGIEVPNLTRGIVRLRELLAHAGHDYALPLFLGKDTVGEPMLADLTKMPHLLIAGATGSGKTVCINTLVLSILMTKKPSEAKLILIDPKMVEMAIYKDIPHLACPSSPT